MIAFLRCRLWAGMFPLALAFAIFCVTGHAEAASLTRSADVASLASLKSYHAIPNFRIGGTYNLDDETSYDFGGEGGTTLESLGQPPLEIGYIAVGKPKKNAGGEIVNAVVINCHYSGGSTSMYNFWYDGQPGNDFSQGAVVGPGKLIDTNEYFVVFVDALGLWGTAKPSSGLGLKFPQYSNFDLVQASYRVLRDELNVAEVQLVTGVSMGGTQTYTWGVLHPDYAKAIMPIGGTTQSDGEDPVQAWLFQLMTAAMKSDPVWRETKGDYYHLPKAKHPNRGVAFGWSILGHTGFTFDFRASQPWDQLKQEVFYWDPKGDEAAVQMKKAEAFDAIDLIYRNNAGSVFNINKELHRITARTLVIHVKTDLWLNYQLAEAAAARIDGARLLGISSPIAHYAVFQAPNILSTDIKAFMEGKSCVATAAAPAGTPVKAEKTKGAFSK